MAGSAEPIRFGPRLRVDRPERAGSGWGGFVSPGTGALSRSRIATPDPCRAGYAGRFGAAYANIIELAGGIGCRRGLGIGRHWSDSGGFRGVERRVAPGVRQFEPAAQSVSAALRFAGDRCRRTMGRDTHARHGAGCLVGAVLIDTHRTDRDPPLRGLGPATNRNGGARSGAARSNPSARSRNGVTCREGVARTTGPGTDARRSIGARCRGIRGAWRLGGSRTGLAGGGTALRIGWGQFRGGCCLDAFGRFSCDRRQFDGGVRSVSRRHGNQRTPRMPGPRQHTVAERLLGQP